MKVMAAIVAGGVTARVSRGLARDPRCVPPGRIGAHAFADSGIDGAVPNVPALTVVSW
jgi:hypothetical protein